MKTIRSAKEIRSLQQAAGKPIYLAVIHPKETRVTPGQAEDILRVRHRYPDTTLPSAWNGYLISGEWNNHHEDIPLHAPDNIGDMLQDILDSGYAVVYEPDLQKELASEYQTRAGISLLLDIEKERDRTES